MQFETNTFDGQIRKHIPDKHLITTIIYQKSLYLFRGNNRSNRKWYKICLNLTVKKPERRHWGRSDVLIVNYEQIYTFFLFLLLTLT